MLDNSVPKSEKWTRSRCFCFLMAFVLIGILLSTFYFSSSQVSWPLHIFRASTYKFKKNMAAAVPHSTLQHVFVTYPHEYHFLLNEEKRCQQESPFLVLMIPVAPHDREARNVIRATWGKETTIRGKVVSHYFLLGLSKEQGESDEQVKEESQKYHDILQSDFLDSYNNLTIKTMVMFEWLNTFCPNTAYAMKIDSDIFLNVHNLVGMLMNAPRHVYMTGMVARKAQVLRDQNSKWFLPSSAFPESIYPPYALGMGYVFSMDLPKKILEASAHVRALYIEDVYVGLCMRHLGIEMTEPPKSGLFRTSAPYMTGNCYWTNVITTILHNSKELLDVWEDYQNAAKHGC